jgi:hypothetical protein
MKVGQLSEKKKIEIDWTHLYLYFQHPQYILVNDNFIRIFFNDYYSKRFLNGKMKRSAKGIPTQIQK